MHFVLKCIRLASERSKIVEYLNHFSTVFNLLEENSKLKYTLSSNDQNITRIRISRVSQMYQVRQTLIESS